MYIIVSLIKAKWYELMRNGHKLFERTKLQKKTRSNTAKNNRNRFPTYTDLQVPRIRTRISYLYLFVSGGGGWVWIGGDIWCIYSYVCVCVIHRWKSFSRSKLFFYYLYEIVVVVVVILLEFWGGVDFFYMYITLWYKNLCMRESVCVVCNVEIFGLVGRGF